MRGGKFLELVFPQFDLRAGGSDCKVDISTPDLCSPVPLQSGPTMTNVTTVSFELPPGISIDATLGSLQIGTSLAVLLFGILSLQCYYYLEHHEGDGSYMKGFVSHPCFSFIDNLRDFCH